MLVEVLQLERADAGGLVDRPDAPDAVDGLLLERRQGTTIDDYVLPERTYDQNPNVKLPHFITPEFWNELRERVFRAFDQKIQEYGLAS